jgi:hypothetical protein
MPQYTPTQHNNKGKKRVKVLKKADSLEIRNNGDG